MNVNEAFENHSSDTLKAVLKDMKKHRLGKIESFKQWLIKKELTKRGEKIPA